MDAEQLGSMLREAYDNAPRGKTVVTIHLFGIDYSKDIIRAGIREVVEKSGIGPSFKAELNKGVNLADYVQRFK